ncbi:MAG: hypothetical protein V3U16_05930, partial [Candidatus Neomarinimicrobiota bacterium]
NIKALQIKGDNLDVVNTHTYSYRNVKKVDFVKLNKNLIITFTNDKNISYHSTILSTNSSFTSKDFDIKKFCAEKKKTSN